jgi:hypothetical protein
MRRRRPEPGLSSSSPEQDWWWRSVCTNASMRWVTWAVVILTDASTCADCPGYGLCSREGLGSGGQPGIPGKSPGYHEKPRELARAARVKGPRIHGACVAALCLHHGVSELWTADSTPSPFTPCDVSRQQNATLGSRMKTGPYFR